MTDVTRSVCGVVLTLVAVGLAGWALSGGGAYRQPAADAAPPASDAPRPRIVGFGSEPVYPQKGGVWQLPAGPGEAILVTDAEHAPGSSSCSPRPAPAPPTRPSPSASTPTAATPMSPTGATATGPCWPT